MKDGNKLINIIDHLKNKIETLQKEKEELENYLYQSKELYNTQKLEKEELKESIKVYDVALEEISQQTEEVENKYEQELKKVNDKNEVLIKNSLHLTDKNKKLETAKKDLEDKLIKIKSHFEGGVEATIGKLEKGKGELEKIEHQKDKLEEENKKLQKSSKISDELSYELQKEKEELLVRLKSIQGDYDRAENKLNSLEKEQFSNRKDLLELREEKKDKSDIIHKNEMEIEKLEYAIADKNSEILKQKQKTYELEEELKRVLRAEGTSDEIVKYNVDDKIKIRKLEKEIELLKSNQGNTYNKNNLKSEEVSNFGLQNTHKKLEPFYEFEDSSKQFSPTKSFYEENKEVINNLEKKINDLEEKLSLNEAKGVNFQDIKNNGIVEDTSKDTSTKDRGVLNISNGIASTNDENKKVSGELLNTKLLEAAEMLKEKSKQIEELNQTISEKDKVIYELQVENAMSGSNKKVEEMRQQRDALLDLKRDVYDKFNLIDFSNIKIRELQWLQKTPIWNDNIKKITIYSKMINMVCVVVIIILSIILVIK